MTLTPRVLMSPVCAGVTWASGNESPCRTMSDKYAHCSLPAHSRLPGRAVTPWTVTLWAVTPGTVTPRDSEQRIL